MRFGGGGARAKLRNKFKKFITQERFCVIGRCRDLGIFHVELRKIYKTPKKCLSENYFFGITQKCRNNPEKNTWRALLYKLIFCRGYSEFVDACVSKLDILDLRYLKASLGVCPCVKKSLCCAPHFCMGGWGGCGQKSKQMSTGPRTNASSGALSGAPGRWKSGPQQRAGPENQDSQQKPKQGMGYRLSGHR